MLALTMLTRERRVWVTSEGIVDGKVGRLSEVLYSSARGRAERGISARSGRGR